MKQQLVSPVTILTIATAVKHVTDFHADQLEWSDDYRLGVKHVATHLASCLLFDAVGVNMSDGDTLSEYLVLPEDGKVLSTKQIEQALTRYVKSKGFRDLATK